MCIDFRTNIIFALGVITLSSVNSKLSNSDIAYFTGGADDPRSNLIYREVNPKYIKFYLYNNVKPKGFRLLRTRNNIQKSGFNKRNPTKVLIHGYTGDVTSPSIQLPKNAYMAVGNYNVIAVDWSEYAFPYAVAINAAPDVGLTIGKMMSFLIRKGGLRAKDLHIIGHSLGAHVAGFSGNRIRNNVKAGRITGLDPAAPAFIGSRPRERLGSEDAEFVDVIHTSIRLLGLTQAIGHVDFYPSGGQFQPRCPTGIVEKVTGNCDHSQAFIFFAESIKNGYLFPAVNCQSVREALGKRCAGKNGAFMGENAKQSNARGIYYVNVNHLKR